MNAVILFDGACNFCDHSVQFIIKRDPEGYYKFASLQSDAGKKLMKQHHISDSMDSFIVVDEGKWFSKSSAALRVCKQLKGCWKLFYILLIVPRPIRDFVYGVLAENRYKWFGKKDRCTIPTPELRKRFL